MGDNSKVLNLGKEADNLFLQKTAGKERNRWSISIGAWTRENSHDYTTNGLEDRKKTLVVNYMMLPQYFDQGR